MKELHLELFFKLPKLAKVKKELIILIDAYVNWVRYETPGSYTQQAEMCIGIDFLGCNLENFILNYKALITLISLKVDSHLLLTFWKIFKMNHNKRLYHH